MNKIMRIGIICFGGLLFIGVGLNAYDLSTSGKFNLFSPVFVFIGTIILAICLIMTKKELIDRQD
jgi:predicted tellurium resistance membrane protein TerC